MFNFGFLGRTPEATPENTACLFGHGCEGGVGCTCCRAGFADPNQAHSWPVDYADLDEADLLGPENLTALTAKQGNTPPN